MQTERARSVVELDGKQAQQTLDLLKSKASDLRTEMNNAFKANDLEGFKKYESELRSTEQAIKNFKKASFDTDAVLQNLTGSTLKDLQKAQNAITGQLRQMERGTVEYAEKVKQLKEVKEEIASIRSEMSVTSESSESFLGKANNWITKWGGMIAGAAAAFAGLAMSLNKFKDYALDIEDAKANLSSLTGLKGNDLDELQSSAEKLGTSTTENGVRITKAANEILDAYTLMGSAKPELLGNKEALNEVTKEALTLAEAAKMETKPAVESLATVMNQFGLGADEASRTINVLAAGSQAGAEEIDGLAASIKNFGPAAASANVGLEQSVALVEALSEKGVKGAESGTGIRNFLLTLQSGTAETNPKVVGLNQALENLAKKNMTAAEMVKMFGKENYVTASILISNKSRVDELTKAVTNTSVAYEQAAINTDTTRAKLSQAQNSFMLQAKVLGEKLAPAMNSVTNLGTKIIKVFIDIPETLKIMAPAIAGVTVAWIAHEVAISKVTIANKLLAFWNDNVIGGLKKIQSLFISNPISAWTAAIGLLATAGMALYRSFSNVNNIGNEFVKKLSEEKVGLDQAFEALKKTKVGTDERRLAIKLINEKYGEYLPNLLSEKSSLKDIEIAQDAATKSMIRNIAAKSKQKEIDDIISKQTEDVAKTTKKLYDKALSDNGSIAAEILIKNISKITEKYKGSYVRDWNKLNEDLNKATNGFSRSVFFNARQIVYANAQIKEQTDNVEAYYKRYLKVLGLSDEVQNKNSAKDKSTQNVKDSSVNSEGYDKESATLDLWLAKRQISYKNDYTTRKLAKQKFDEEMLALELTYLLKQKGLQEKYGKSSVDTQNKIADLKLSEKEKKEKEQLDQEKEFKEFMSDLEKKTNEGINDLLEKSLKDKLNKIKKNNDDIEKEQEESTKKRAEELKNYSDIAQQFATNLGQTIGQYVSGVLDEQTSFANALINIAIDSLHNVVQIAVANIVAKEIATKGWIGILTGAALTAVVETAFAVAKAAVRPVSQRAEGKYDVLAEDGRTYSAEWDETPTTGVYTRPTLFAERGSELIVDNSTLNRIRLNTPWVLDEIMRQRVPQRAEGKYDTIQAAKAIQPDTNYIKIIEANIVVMNELSGILKNGISATMSMSHFQNAKDKYDAITTAAKRG